MSSRRRSLERELAQPPETDFEGIPSQVPADRLSVAQRSLGKSSKSRTNASNDLRSSPNIILISAEYADQRLGGLATYTDLLVNYLRRRFSRIYIVETPYVKLGPASTHRGRFGETIITVCLSDLNDASQHNNQTLNWLTQLLPLDKPLLIIGNESSSAVIAKHIRKACLHRTCLIYVPHMLAVCWYFRGYSGPRLSDLINDVPPFVMPILNQEREMLRSADYVLHISNYMRECTTRTLGHAPKNEAIIPHYTESFVDKKESYSSEIRNIIFHGRLESQKGLQAIFEHLKEIFDLLPRATLHIYGEGSQEMMLVWSSLRVRDRIVWHGYRPREELLRDFRNMDLCIVPSIYEPFGYSALEAMAAGIPLVTSDAGGLGELTAWMPDGLRLRTVPEMFPSSGIFSAVGMTIPAGEIWRVFSFVAMHPDQVANSGRLGTEIVRRYYSFARYARQMDALIERCLRKLEPLSARRSRKVASQTY